VRRSCPKSLPSSRRREFSEAGEAIHHVMGRFRRQPPITTGRSSARNPTVVRKESDPSRNDGAASGGRFSSIQGRCRRYGEPDNRGTRFGRPEPLTHFARRKGIQLATLLADLADATQVPVETYTLRAQRIHHGFLLSALIITLSLGTGWGAWILWSIGSEGGFDAVAPASITAHGEAQLWGFNVLFIMGISLRTALQGIVRHPLGLWVCRALLASWNSRWFCLVP
jgi:hypothetical protein